MSVLPNQRLVLAFLLFGLFAAMPFAQQPSGPDYLWAQATLYRDEWGVPHVYAENVRAMGFAFGYAQAEDHLEAMLVAYRMANGRAAEIFGEALAPSDEFAIKLGHAELARAAWPTLDPITRDLCEGFALGANAWLVEHAQQAPPWADGVSPYDPLALLHAYFMTFAPFDVPGEFRPPRGTPSANAWAVSPEKSQGGEAVLVINPHEDYTGAYRWYEAHLATEGYDVYGATLFGVPVILQGHNAALGWALAPNEPDIADVYVERAPAVERNPKSLMPQRIEQELFFQAKLLSEVRAYYVRTPQGLVERRVQHARTPRGPVMLSRGGRPLSWRIGGYGDFGAIRQFLEMGAAKDLKQFRYALNLHQLPLFHVVYADKDGNILYRYNAKVGYKRDFGPIVPASTAAVSQPARSPWDAPLSVGESVFDWGPFIAPDNLPTILNPPAGYVQACGAPPWLANDATGAGPEQWPGWFARDEDTPRARRVRQLFALGPRSFLDNQAMLYDLVVPMAVEAVPFLLRAAEAHPEFVRNTHPDFPAVLDMLREWDFRAETTSGAMTFFHAWWTTLQPLQRLSPTQLSALVRENAPTTQQQFLESAVEATRLTRNQFQLLGTPWGDVHAISRGDKERPWPGSVSGGPLFTAADHRFDNGKWRVTGGYGFAMAVQFGPKPEAVTTVPFGASEDPTSSHFADQLDLMAERRFKIARYVREDVERFVESARGMKIYLRSRDGRARFYAASTRPLSARLEMPLETFPGLPEGYAAFSPAITPVIGPADAPLFLEMTFTVPDELCSLENLSRLSLCAYGPELGWRPVPDQRPDRGARLFYARVQDAKKVFAVLGPADARRAGPPAPFERAPVVPRPQNYEPLTAKRDFSGETSNVASNAPGDTPSRRTQVTRNFNRGLPSPAESGPRTRPQAPAPNPETAPPPGEAPSRPGLTPPPEPVTAAPSPDTAQGKRNAGPDPFTPPDTPPAPQQPTGPAPSPAPPAPGPKPEEKKGRLIISMQPLEELVGKKSTREERLFLAPEGAVASPMFMGDNIQLRPPVPGILIHVKTAHAVRAQAMIHLRPPEPLPDGLAEFTAIVELLVAPPGVPGMAFVTFGVPPGVCAPDRVGELRLYTYDPANGWKLFDGQKSTPEAASFSGVDSTYRTYTVLGPVSARIRPPVPAGLP